ncbi:MAG: MFS transporter [Verrucomicrobiota bacterium]
MNRSSSERKRIIAGSVGNVLEWFDFASYGFFAAVIGEQFFPSDDPTISIIAAFAVFASGFLARPLGAMFFGHLGDKRGRAVVLQASVILMGVSTLLIGCLPNYATIGIAAPILLTVLRVAQGFSVGGEYMGSIIYLVERAPAKKRGFVGSWVNVGATLGFLLGSGLGALISGIVSEEALASWGWRVPFLLGVGIALFAAVFRRHMTEEPGLASASEEKIPLIAAVRLEWRTMLRIAGLVLMANIGFYMMFVYVTTYLAEQVGVSMARALEIDTVAMGTLVIIVPITAWLSDRIGRKPVLLVSSIGCAVLSLPLFMVIHHDDTLLIFLGQLAFAILLGGAFGANSAAIVELTKVRYRCTVISVAYNVSVAIFGGTTPLVAAWLIRNTGQDLVPALYLTLGAIITAITVLTMPETYRRDITPTKTEPESLS